MKLDSFALQAAALIEIPVVFTMPYLTFLATFAMSLLAGALAPGSGEVLYHPAIQKGFFEQTNVSHLIPNRTVEEEIGRGGAATVYAAADLRHERRVAVKVLHPDLATGPGAERFLSEIRIAADSGTAPRDGSDAAVTPPQFDVAIENDGTFTATDLLPAVESAVNGADGHSRKLRQLATQAFVAELRRQVLDEGAVVRDEGEVRRRRDRDAPRDVARGTAHNPRGDRPEGRSGRGAGPRRACAPRHRDWSRCLTRR